MMRPWTRAEKWLFATPLLFGLTAVGLTIGPTVVRKARGYPTELPVAPGTSITRISLSSDGRLLAAATQAVDPQAKVNTIHFWDVHTLKPLPPLTRPLDRVYNPAIKKSGPDHGTYTLALSPQGDTMVWKASSSGATVTDLPSRRKLWSTSGGLNATFSPDGKWLALAHSQQAVRIVEARTGKTVTGWTWKSQQGEVAVSFSPQGNYFASSSARPKWDEWAQAPNQSGGDIELRRVDGWKVERVLPLPNTEKISFSPDESSLVGVATVYETPYKGGGTQTRLRCFDITTGRVKWKLDPDKPGNPSQDMRLHPLVDACFSPDGAFVAVLSPIHAVVLLDANDGTNMRRLRFPHQGNTFSGAPQGLAFSPDGKRLFARGRNAVLVWDLD